MAYDGVAPSGRRVDLLLRLADILDNVPGELYNQREWREERACGTVACAFGWGMLKMPEEFSVTTRGRFLYNKETDEPCTNMKEMFGAIAKDFGITLNEALQLFGTDSRTEAFYGVEVFWLTPTHVATKLREFALSKVTTT